MKNIEIDDSVVLKFKKQTIVEIYESKNDKLDDPLTDLFKKNEEVEVTIYGVDEEKFDVQFGDGTIAFIRKDDVKIISVN